MKLHSVEERLCRETGYTDGLAISLGNQISMYIERKDFCAALRLCDEQIQIYQQLKDNHKVAQCLAKQTGLLCELGRLEEALTICTRAEQVCHAINNPTWVENCMTRKAAILRRLAESG
jgi:hypothetical protein